MINGGVGVITGDLGCSVVGEIISSVRFCFFLTKLPVRGPGQKKKLLLFVLNSVDLAFLHRRLLLCTELYIRLTSDLPSIRRGYSNLSDFAYLLHGGATSVCSSLYRRSYLVPFYEGPFGTAPSSLLRHA